MGGIPVPATICTQCRLGKVRNGICDTCGDVKSNRNKIYNSNRPSARQQGYNYTWEKIRERVLRREPLCKMCAINNQDTLAVLVDHIVPLKAGGTHATENLQGLCISCHRIKTEEDKKKYKL